MKIINLSAAVADTVYTPASQICDVVMMKVPHDYAGVCTVYDGDEDAFITLTADGVAGVEFRTLANLNKMKYESTTTGVCLEVLLP